MVWALICAIVIPNLGCWIATAAVWNKIEWFNSDLVKKPKHNPPNWTLSIIWTGLFSCMGYASYLVYTETGGFTRAAALPLSLYGVKLLVNWTWLPVLLVVRNMGLSLIHMLIMDAMMIATSVSFFLVNTTTAYFMAPYAAWLVYDTSIAYGMWKLNQNNYKATSKI